MLIEYEINRWSVPTYCTFTNDGLITYSLTPFNYIKRYLLDVVSCLKCVHLSMKLDQIMVYYVFGCSR